MNASSLMTRELHWIAEDATVAEAACALAALPPGASCLLVGEGLDRPHGIVTAVDVLRGALGTALYPGRLACAKDAMLHCGDLAREELAEDMARAARAALVRDVMSSSVLCVPADASASEVMDLLIRRKIESLPVLDGERVIGIVHRRAVLGAIGAMMCDAAKRAPQASACAPARSGRSPCASDR